MNLIVCITSSKSQQPHESTIGLEVDKTSLIISKQVKSPEPILNISTKSFVKAIDGLSQTDAIYLTLE